MPRERIATAPQGRANRWSTKTGSEVLTGTKVIGFTEFDSFQTLALDANGAARNVDLPAEEAVPGGYMFIINTAGAAFSLTVRNDAAGTVVVIPQGKCALVWCDGVTWRTLLGA